MGQTTGEIKTEEVEDRSITSEVEELPVKQQVKELPVKQKVEEIPVRYGKQGKKVMVKPTYDTKYHDGKDVDPSKMP